MTLVPLTPKEVYEDQIKMRETKGQHKKSKAESFEKKKRVRLKVKEKKRVRKREE